VDRKTGEVPSPDNECVPTRWGKYDMVVVGCQEGDYKERKEFESCEDDWIAGIAATIGDSYVLHRRNTLGQMRVAAFVRADIQAAVHRWVSSTEATGLGHVLSNKGGVGVVCRVWDTQVCFINSHLAAHDDMTARRNDDFAEIVQGCRFGEKMECTQAFHHLVWMGDLNYRCEWGLGDSKAVARSPSKERAKLMASKLDEPAGRAEVFETDQLTAARLAGDAFLGGAPHLQTRVQGALLSPLQTKIRYTAFKFCCQLQRAALHLGFQEGEPASHPPTFKVERRAGFEYKAQRTPAWCDRVLWKTAEVRPRGPAGGRASNHHIQCCRVRSTDQNMLFCGLGDLVNGWISLFCFWRHTHTMLTWICMIPGLTPRGFSASRRRYMRRGEWGAATTSPWLRRLRWRCWCTPR